MVTIKRKIIQHGPSTLIVSLPSNWVKQNGIKKGDELDVREEGKTLIIGVDKVTTNLTLTQDVSTLKPFLVTRFLARAYQKGYDRIHLTHNNPELLKTIQEKTLELIGYEIIEQNGKHCLIQSISSKIELDFDNSLRKAFLITKQMLEACYEAYRDGDKPTLKNLYLKDIEVNRFTYFCLRQINKEQYVDAERAQQSHILYYLIEILEDLGDNAKQLATQLSEGKRKSKELTSLLKLMLEQFDVSYHFFYKPSAEKVNQAYTFYKEIEDKLKAILSTDLTEDEIQAVYLIRDSSRIIYHFTTMRLDFLKDAKKEVTH